MKVKIASSMLTVFSLAAILWCTSCGNNPKKAENNTGKSAYSIEEEFFGTTAEGDSVQLFTLCNKDGITVKITNYGGIVTEIHTPDREGKIQNVVLGFDNFASYLEGHPYFGAIIGRFSNRIAGSQFSIGDAQYQLAANDGNNSLHGGLKGFDKAVWLAKPGACEENASLELSYTSIDGEEGYPGNLSTKVIYTLEGDQLIIDYLAETDKATPLNLTNHSYFNLSGKGSILDHVLYINASQYTPVNPELIPTGELANVEATPFDFRKPTAIGERIKETGGEPLGYDHNFVLDDKENESKLAAKLMDPVSGRFLEVHTTEPGVQFYTGNFLDGSLESGGISYEQYNGLCLETQHFPDSPNQPDFPNAILHPGEKFKSRTIFKFGVEK